MSPLLGDPTFFLRGSLRSPSSSCGSCGQQISIAERYLCFDLFRSLFIRSHDLPRQFLFDRYLSYCYKRAIRDVVDIKPHAWMAVIVICAVDIGVSGLHAEMARGLLGPVHFLYVAFHHC